MKNINKSLLSFILAVVFITPTSSYALTEDVDPQGSSSCVDLQNNMRYRMTDAQTGGEVTVLQDFLQAGGFLNTNPVGFFGLLTTAAVQKFQSAHAISPTGYVGPLTRAQIKTASCAGLTTTPASPTTQTVIPVSQDANGCRAGVMYNSTTGAPCTTIPTTTNACPLGQVFNKITGARCPDSTSGCPGDQLYNTYTGGLCRTIPLPTDGCSTGSMYNNITGKPCANTVATTEGCPPGQIYSSATGAPCSSNTSVVAPTVRLTASPTSIFSDGKPGAVSISWTSTNATSCLFEKRTLPATGSLNFSISATGTFTVGCTGPGGFASSNPVTVTFELTNTSPVEGCALGQKYSSVNGAFCPSTTNGCPVGQIYSSVTGAPCPVN